MFVFFFLIFICLFFFKIFICFFLLFFFQLQYILYTSVIEIGHVIGYNVPHNIHKNINFAKTNHFGHGLIGVIVTFDLKKIQTPNVKCMKREPGK